MYSLIGERLNKVQMKLTELHILHLVSQAVCTGLSTSPGSEDVHC